MMIMDDKEIAKRIVAAAKKAEGYIFVGDIGQSDIDFGLKQGWLVTVTDTHVELTEAGRVAAA
jgi:hypothetical protein